MGWKKFLRFAMDSNSCPPTHQLSAFLSPWRPRNKSSFTFMFNHCVDALQRRIRFAHHRQQFYIFHFFHSFTKKVSTPPHPTSILIISPVSTAKEKIKGLFIFFIVKKESFETRRFSIKDSKKRRSWVMTMATAFFSDSQLWQVAATAAGEVFFFEKRSFY